MALWMCAAGVDLCCAALSPGGRWAACSDPFQLKLFAVSVRCALAAGRSVPEERCRARVCVAGGAQEEGRFAPHATAAELPAAGALLFVPGEERLVAACLDGTVRVLAAASGAVEHEFEHFVEGRVDVRPAAAALGRAVVRTLAVSEEGRWLAAGDSLNRVLVFDLQRGQVRCAPRVWRA